MILNDDYLVMCLVFICNEKKQNFFAVYEVDQFVYDVAVFIRFYYTTFKTYNY